MAAYPCHPPPTKAAPSAASTDPYKTLGLDHDAAPTQIKIAYRKLALRYHPDRQQSPLNVPVPTTGADGAQAQSPLADDTAKVKEATDKFAEIATAYAILSDPVKKKEYDHLYKYGAFDIDDADYQNGGHGSTPSSSNNATSASTNNYQYTEDYSGGYYKPGYTPPTPAQSAQQQRAAAFNSFREQFQSMASRSQDSFFDDLIYSPKSQQKKQSSFSTNENDNDADTDNPSTHANVDANASNTANANPIPQHKKQPGIGFSFAPLGKHLSVHVPSRNEVTTNMTRGDMPRGAHLFGTRVTFSQQSSSGLGKLERIATCGGDNAVCSGGGCVPKEKKVVCQTTRIAKGQKRIVKRTAHLHRDGRKEVVIEENGVVRRRYVEENPNNIFTDNSTTGGNSTANSEGSSQQQHRDDDDTAQKEEEAGGLQKESHGFTLAGLFKTCFAPCSAPRV